MDRIIARLAHVIPSPRVIPTERKRRFAHHIVIPTVAEESFCTGVSVSAQNSLPHNVKSCAKRKDPSASFGVTEGRCNVGLFFNGIK